MAFQRLQLFFYFYEPRNKTTQTRKEPRLINRNKARRPQPHQKSRSMTKITWLKHEQQHLQLLYNQESNLCEK